MMNSNSEQIYLLMKASFDNFFSEVEKICGLSFQENQWLDTKQVCDIFNVKIGTLNAYRQRGLIPFSRIGNKCYYRVDDVKELLNDPKFNKNG